MRQGTPAPQLPPQPVQPAQLEVRSNIVCEGVGFTFVQIDDHDIVRRGLNHIAVVAQFVNEPRADRHILSEDYVMARIRYFDADGSLCQQVHHGSWLEEEWRWVEFDVGDTRHLVLAVQLTDEQEFNPALTALRTIENNHEGSDKYETPNYPDLSPTVSRAEVQLYTGESGAIIGQFAFQLSFGRERRVTVIEPSGESRNGQK